MEIRAVLKEFEAFILKGNVVDLAVGVVIGTAFKSVVDAIVACVINPLLMAMRIIPGPATFSFAGLLNSMISFVAIAAVVFFLVVKPMNALLRFTKWKAEQKPAEPPPLPEDVKLLMEIRDLMKTAQDQMIAPPAAPPRRAAD
jgi:large conductance mechanosensitive channel